MGRTGGGDGAAASPAEGVPELVAELLRRVPLELRRPDGPLLHAIDHCFGIRGQGTVLTGTVLRVSLLASVCRGYCLLLVLCLNCQPVRQQKCENPRRPDLAGTAEGWRHSRAASAQAAAQGGLPP